ncbi:MAG: hypothetical protein RLZZ568_1873 [Cyanobacteriota bacterium]|jgi:cellulose synthase/poly-beta-1,6-N-acetylglucosamine synthase-like glycosyltransferase
MTSIPQIELSGLPESAPVVLLNGLLILMAFLWLLPSLVLFAECGSAVLLSKPVNPLTPIPLKATYQILIPAHNEAAVISATLASLLTQVEHPSQIIVIADNCTDNTANLARCHHVKVVERHDPERLGKGFALDFGIQALKGEPPDGVIVIDADCVVAPGTIAVLVNEAQTHQRPIQALYLLQQPQPATPKDTLSAFAFMVKNQIRPAGLTVWNLPCLLTGTGMAFPWQIIGPAPLATDNIVEDIQLSIDLAIAGHPPRFCEAARVTGILPQQAIAAIQQRQRWEHGYLQTLLGQGPRLIAQAVKQRRCDLLALAAEISVVPLSLWGVIWLGELTLSLINWQSGGDIISLYLLLIAGFCLAIAVISAWAKYGRQGIPLPTLLAVPLYVLWKMPLYGAFWLNRQCQWVRTERDRP